MASANKFTSKIVMKSTRNLFQPMNIIPRNVKRPNREGIPKSLQLMLDMGIIKTSSNGIYTILPLGVRAINKLQSLIDDYMMHIGAQKLQLPILIEGNLWKTSGRWDSKSLHLFKLKDRHDKDYLLGPTHEESIAELLASSASLSYSQFPLLLYQITSKFRDELKPRCGLLRTREFLMKDLYSFHTNTSQADQTYNQVCDVYDKLFKTLSLPYYKVIGCADEMGGRTSHEFHIPVDVGEDTLLVCDECKKASNIELNQSKKCSFCGSGLLNEIKSVEVGHTFFLGSKYSELFKAVYKNEENKLDVLSMGSYGLGLTRIVMAAVEHLSIQDQIRWPSRCAPFNVLIITAKEGSKEADESYRIATELYSKLSSFPKFEDDILLDDRSHLTIGKRILFAKQTGYPFLVILGAGVTKIPSLIELQIVKQGITYNLTVAEVLDFFSKCGNEQ